MKMNKKNFFLLVLSVFLLNGTLFAQEQEEYEYLKNFTIIEPVHPHDFNPQTTSYSSDAQILTGLFEGLFTYDPVSLSPLYAVAKDYRISRDKKKWTFTINPDAYFSNGDKITAQSVRNSWLKLLSTPNAPYASLLDVIKGASDYRNGKISAEDVGIYANSEDSLSIHLEKPANYLPRLLCHSAFSIVHENPYVFSGAFCLTETGQNYYKLEKNQYYWDKGSVNLEEIYFYQSDDAAENTFYFNTGIADWITGNADTASLLNKNAFSLSSEFATSYFFFKVTGEPWNHVEFRAAIMEAVPWEVLRKDYYVPATTFVYPLSGYPQVDGYSYSDVLEAKNMMKEAREKYGFSEDEVIPLVFEITENSVSGERLTAFSDALAELGVELIVKQKKPYEYYEGVAASDSNMFLYTWIGDFADPLAFLELFRGDSTLNDSKWKNEEYDSLIDQAAEVSDTERYKLLAQAENLLLDECLVLPIQHPVIYNIIDKNAVGGWSENAFDIHPLKYLYKKVEKTTVPNVVYLKN